jgi:hypothetical protein
MIIVAQAYRNGGADENTHICPECVTKAVRHIRDLLTEALGDAPDPGDGKEPSRDA